MKYFSINRKCCVCDERADWVHEYETKDALGSATMSRAYCEEHMPEWMKKSIAQMLEAVREPMR